MMITCCKDCDRREIGCHSKCDEYKAQKAEIDRVNEIRKKANDLEYEFHEFRRVNVEKRIRSMGGYYSGKKVGQK